MKRRTVQLSIRNYWWHALVATLLVALAPPLVVMWLEHSGRIDSALVSAAAGVAGSVAAATIGAALWMRHAGSSDVVFGDLLVWGFLRRLVTEKRIMESERLLTGAKPGRSSTSPAPTFELQTLQKLAAALEAMDPYTHGHSRRVARLSSMIARELGLSKRGIELLRTAAAVHDIGKLYVPGQVINKPGKLTPEEMEVVRQHSVHGAELVARTGNKDLVALVRHHHERIDGKGYPDGLAGANIPLGARIIAVADTFDSVTSSRPYRSAATHKTAIAAIKEAAGSQLDPEVVDAFLKYYSGRRSLARWALLLVGPHRWFGHLTGWFQGAAAAGLKSSAAAAGAAAILSGSVIAGATVAPAVAKSIPGLGRSETPAYDEGRKALHTQAGGRHGGEPHGLAKKGGVAPGLAKKGGVAPGLAKKGGVAPGLANEGGEPQGLAKKDRVPRAHSMKDGLPPAQASKPSPDVKEKAGAARTEGTHGSKDEVDSEVKAPDDVQKVQGSTSRAGAPERRKANREG